MTDAGKEIIEIFKTRKIFSLARNKEFWEKLSYENEKIINSYGDTYRNIETGKHKISPAKALKKIKDYFIRHSQIWENKSISTDTEILEYWKRWNQEG